MFAFFLPVAEADLAVPRLVAGQNVSFPEYPAIEVTPQIDERLVAVADTFAIDDPFPGEVCLR